ncbi:MAG: hypothetical protein LQ347_006608 [Umbilicaria vellea]|nr:MAG: hypothetical protein LQ347_006608 [Umbilicaria vellea]
MIAKQLILRRVLQLPSRILQTRSHRNFSIRSGVQQVQGKTNSQRISELARKEGGPTEGSPAAQLQSQVTKERQAQQGNSQQGNSQQGNNQQTGKSIEGQLISEVAREEGGTSKGSESARLQSQLTKERNAHQGTGQAGSTLQQNPATSSRSSNPTQQSQQARQADYEEVASKVQEKITTDPASVTPEDGNLARSRETRAFGTTEKGGVAATAQSLGSENAKAGRV